MKTPILKLSQKVGFFIKVVHLTLPSAFTVNPPMSSNLLHEQYHYLHWHNHEEQMVLFEVNWVARIWFYKPTI